METRPLPLDRAFWADDGYGEIVRVRYSPDLTGYAPCAMFAPLDDDDGYGGDEPLIWATDITDWDDDRDALAARIEADLITTMTGETA